MELNEILENITILKNGHTFNVFLLISLFIVDIAIYCAIYSFIEDKINDAILTSVLESIASIRNKYGNKMEVKDKSGNRRGYTFELTRAAREELGGFFKYAE